MNAAANLPSYRADPWVEPIRVVVLYESARDLENARDIVHAFTGAAGANQDIKLAAWSFAMLTRLDLRHASAAIGADVDFLFIAAAAESCLPAHVKSWVTECLRDHTEGAPRIVGLYETMDSHSRMNAMPALQSDMLRLVANSATKPLFNNEFDPQGEWLRLQKEKFSHDDLVRTGNSEAELLFARPPGGHWGINE